MPGRKVARRGPARRKNVGRAATKRHPRKNRQTVSRGFRKRVSSRFEKPSAVVIKQPSGLPDRLFVRLKYVEFLTFSQAAGALSANVYRGNDLFDPDFTGTGGQPYFLNQWGAFYSNFFVHGSSIDFQVQGGGGSWNNLTFGITPAPTSTSFGGSGQELIMEQPYSRYKALQMGALGIGQNRMKSYMSTRKILGLHKATALGIQYAGTTSSSPSAQWFWFAWMFAPDNNTIAVQATVKLTYYVEFYNRLRPAVS